MAIYRGNKKGKFYIGNQKIKKIYLGIQKVFSAGNWVTYYVDTNNVQTEEIDEGLSVLTPSTFSPSKNSWVFHGWRENNTATSGVLATKVMGDDPISIYAVFKKNVTLSIYNNSIVATTKSGYRYYNNGNVLEPTFTVAAASKSGWTFNGWCTTTGATDAIAYSTISSRPFLSDATVYARYSKNVTLTYNGNGATSGSNASQTSTAYYNSSGNTSSPTFSLQANGFKRTGYLFGDWALGSASGDRYSEWTTISLGSNNTVYAVWNPITYYIAYNGNGATSGSMGNSTHIYDTAKELTDNAYTKNGYSFKGWATSTYGAVSYNNKQSVSNLSSTHGATVNLYAVWSDNAYYAIQNGILQSANAPNAWAWCGGYSDPTSGNVYDVHASNYAYYGGNGHTNNGSGSWGADTNTINTNGCKYLSVSTYSHNWSDSAPTAQLNIWGNDTVIKTEWVPNGGGGSSSVTTYTIDVSAYSSVRVRINASDGDNFNAWIHVGFREIRLYN